jgi:hypothetical protein
MERRSPLSSERGLSGSWDSDRHARKTNRSSRKLPELVSASEEHCLNEQPAFNRQDAKKPDDQNNPDCPFDQICVFEHRDHLQDSLLFRRSFSMCSTPFRSLRFILTR